MMITVHLSDGRKITKDYDRLNFFSAERATHVDQMPAIEDGCITINLEHVVDMRPAEPDEIEHAKIHGW